MQKTRENERRDSGIIFILILLLGFICIILASGWALRFAPSWKLNTSMGSNLDPNSDFLTSRPVGFIDPLDPAILTNPAWINIFLTPGASLPKRTPLPASTATNIPPNTNTPIPIPTLIPPATNTLVVFVPPPPAKTKVPPPPPPPPTAVPPTALPSADLQITKADGSLTYTAGNAITYTIVVSNAGPANATGASVADTIPATITGTTISCTPNGTASCGTNASAGNNLSYTGVNITAGVGNSVTITVSGTINPATTGALVNTATVTMGAGQTDPTPGNNSATDTDTPSAITANLGITKTDNATNYAPGVSVQYMIVASNVGPGGVTGATVVDAFSANLVPASIIWTCAGSGGATCTAGAAGNINDSAVNLPAGTSVTYTVNATVVASPTGTLDNTASVSVPAGITDPVPGNNSATDSDQLVVASSLPFGNIGTAKDGVVDVIPAGTFVTLQFGTPVVVGGHAGYDLVYYELSQGTNPGIFMDAVILQVGDGKNWYTILNWGNGASDANTNIALPLLTSPPNPTTCAGEPDNCEIDASLLYNATGVAIDLDGVVPVGTYPYIRILSPGAPPDVDGGVEVDAIEILP